MNNIKPVKAQRAGRLKAAAALALGLALAYAPATSGAEPTKEKPSMQNEQTLSASRQAIGPIAAFAAIGDIGRLKGALEQGLGAGLTVSECKEILIQLYAYAGFPRSLNALTGLMQVLEERKRRGIVDAPGTDPAPALTGEALLASGTANQTKLVGAPVKGPVLEFAPAIDRFLKTHLFGDIFNRDNLDWRSRELATVAALASLSGLEAQLRSHVKVSMNVGISEAQLRQFIQVLATRVDSATAQRAQAALDGQESRPVTNDSASKIALRELVDTFSILADQKEARKQTELFTEDAQVTTYSDGTAVSTLSGRKAIGDAFDNFLKNFETVYHMNGQHVVAVDGKKASGQLYCITYLFGARDGKKTKTTIGVRYSDQYEFVGDRWLISSRTSYFDWRTVEPVAN